MQLGAHIVVHGIVQGVGYRWFAYRLASRLALTGWVRNLMSGEVEIEVEGDRSAVEALLEDLKVGPRSAHVKDLTIEWQGYGARFETFEIL